MRKQVKTKTKRKRSIKKTRSIKKAKTRTYLKRRQRKTRKGGRQPDQYAMSMFDPYAPSKQITTNPTNPTNPFNVNVNDLWSNHKSIFNNTTDLIDFSHEKNTGNTFKYPLNPVNLFAQQPPPIPHPQPPPQPPPIPPPQPLQPPVVPIHNHQRDMYTQKILTESNIFDSLKIVLDHCKEYYRPQNQQKRKEQRQTKRMWNTVGTFFKENLFTRHNKWNNMLGNTVCTPTQHPSSECISNDRYQDTTDPYKSVYQFVYDNTTNNHSTYRYHPGRHARFKRICGYIEKMVRESRNNQNVLNAFYTFKHDIKEYIYKQYDKHINNTSRDKIIDIYKKFYDIDTIPLYELFMFFKKVVEFGDELNESHDA